MEPLEGDEYLQITEGAGACKPQPMDSEASPKSTFRLALRLRPTSAVGIVISWGPAIRSLMSKYPDGQPSVLERYYWERCKSFVVALGCPFGCSLDTYWRGVARPILDCGAKALKDSTIVKCFSNFPDSPL